MLKTFEDLIDPFIDHPDTTPPRRLVPYMLSMLKPFGKWLPVMAVMSVCVAVVEVSLLFYTGRLIDLMSESGVAAFWRDNGLELVIAAIAIIGARPFIIGLAHLFLEQTLVSNTQDLVRWRSHRHMLGQSMTFFQNDFAGRLSNRVMQQGPAVEDSSYMMFEAVWFALVYVISAAVMIAAFDLWLVLPLALWLGAYISYNIMLARRVAIASEKASDARSMVTGRVVDAYANIETVKLFADEQQEEGYVLSAMRRHRLRLQRFLRLMTEMHFLLNFLNGAMICGILGLAMYLWSVGSVTIGEVAAASALVMRLNGMSGWIMWVTIRLFEHMGVIREGLRSIAVPHALVDEPKAPALKVSEGEIRFDHVTQHYGKGAGGLDALDLTIHPGERVGLVGRSGAGKSSLVNLLLRFRDPEAGRILIDGQDIAHVRQTSLRQQIGMVTQDSSLLHRSIRANLLYGRPDATEAQMIHAAKQAAAHDFILGLQDKQGRRGYDAHVGERGVKLSGGQRQRIAMARVILKDAPILVLDEATSALDSEVEAQIQETLYNVMSGKTVIAIAHRLSTIAHMDRIIVLDRGRIAEQGSHSDLLAKGGLYAGFWTRQSGGFLNPEAAE
ncbi:multidrug ABC transporter ATP-binding protein [Marinibacterium profundimaris]|uniref:Multidrug ABC transporter ATP-binding protein n=1 Tax=Marinibacterium profundimaris TaxID=1679460 RepID=A0A225NSZ1_9RHOB|nr:multidrug ABC transporter ATP-binding protein [Marinibacterium profundimaris]